ncbi:CHAT domain-containing protein [Schizothecium vesticola]|uniref:CHAT domain-containing protein n=1 Tax=Schizothecium vesticola TaxID=314040 RepID=A0AA40F5W2_9PEZI|nr:CHAT domain-containing protein [Schizothecium vesticola]
MALQPLANETDGLERLRVASELSDVLQAQGYLSTAFETLERAIQDTPSEYKTHSACLRRRMEACLLGQSVKASFSGVVERACDILDEVSTPRDVDDFDIDLLHLAYAKVCVGTARFHDPAAAAQGLDSALAWLLPKFHRLMESHMEREAFRCAAAYGDLARSGPSVGVASLSLATAVDMMERIATSPQTPPLLKAKALAELGWHGKEYGIEMSRVDSFEAEAIRMFDAAGHAHGAIDIRIRQLARHMEDNLGSLPSEAVQDIETYFLAYERLNCVAAHRVAVATILAALPSESALGVGISLSDVGRTLATAAGTKLGFLLTETAAWGRWLLHSGRAARVVEGVVGWNARVLEEDCRMLKGKIAYCGASAYLELRDFEKAYEWASRACMAWGAWFPLRRAEAANHALEARLSGRGSTWAGDEDALIAQAELEISKDLEHGLEEPAISKLELVATMVLIPRRDARCDGWLDKMEERIQVLSEISPAAGRQKKATLCQLRALALAAAITKGELGAIDDMGDECLAHLEHAVSLHLEDRRVMQACSARSMQTGILFVIFEKTRSRRALNKCLEISVVVRDTFRDMEQTRSLAEATRQYATYLHEAFRRGLVTGEQVLLVLKEAEESLHQGMADMTVLGSFEAVSRRQQLTSPHERRLLYHRAFDVCDKLWRISDLWDWVQLAKARSLSSQLGVHSLVPAELRDRAMGDAAAMELLNMEEQTTRAIAAADHADRLRLRTDLYRIHQQMAKHEVLKHVLDVKNGIPVSWGHICELATQIQIQRQRQCQLAGSNVVLIDWVDLRGSLWLLAVSSCADDASRPLIECCGITIDAVASWKRRWLDAEPGSDAAFEDEDAEEDDDFFSLRELDCLVAPLKQFTNRGDLLVFSPTGILHPIPLQALWIEDQTPAIVRNPIVFSASLTVFSQCCRRAAEVKPPLSTLAEKQQPLPKSSWNMVGVLEDEPGCRFPPTERSDVYNAIRHLAERHGAAWSTGSAVTRRFVAEAMQQSVLVHYHGHCRLDREAVADQSLQLCDGSLAVRDVFSLKLRGPHITLVACDSASQGITAGDEPLGLVTALLCAGAGSVLGTLWPTASETGRVFAERFYAELESQQRGSSVDQVVVVDLAVALQKAVLAVRAKGETRKPYHWAAFVLHGSWSMNLPRL